MAVQQFLLPDLGEGLEDAEVVAWKVKEGDHVELNQVLVEVNTAKALVEIPSPWVGVVTKLHAGEGDVVNVGRPLVSIDVEGTQGTTKDQKPKRQALLVGYGVAEEADAPAAPARLSPARERSGGGPVPASPPVRRLAKELGIDLGSVDGSGPGGRVTREDVMKAAEGVGTVLGRQVADAAGDERIPLRGVRRLTAQKMTRSAKEIPHVTTFLTVDATALEAFRGELERDTGTRFTALPVIVRAFIEVAKQFRSLNATFDAAASEIVLRGDLNVGIATVIYFIVYQQMENYFIVPRVMKKAVDLSPAAVIVSVLIGGSLAGFAGALLALPLAAAAKVVIRDVWLRPRIEMTESPAEEAIEA